LLHHADVTAIEGDSYRMRESELETAAAGGRNNSRGFPNRSADIGVAICHEGWLYPEAVRAAARHGADGATIALELNRKYGVDF